VLKLVQPEPGKIIIHVFILADFSHVAPQMHEQMLTTEAESRTWITHVRTRRVASVCDQ